MSIKLEVRCQICNDTCDLIGGFFRVDTDRMVVDSMGQMHPLHILDNVSMPRSYALCEPCFKRFRAFVGVK